MVPLIPVKRDTVFICGQGGYLVFLYLVQHGEARKEEEDPARGLTDKGLRDVRKVAAYVQNTGLRVNQVFHSGKTRAL